MNGNWSPWGYRHTSPAAFVAAWRHIVTLFRALGAQNVTWLWTVNIVNDTQQRQDPAARPVVARQLVRHLGGDRRLLPQAVTGSSLRLFGPTIAQVRALTSDPILIAETGATPTAGQPAKIADVFAGVHAYGLLGFVWFDATNSVGQAFGISGSGGL